jgi:NIPSNAP protein
LGVAAGSAFGRGIAQAQEPKRPQLLELRLYRLRIGPMVARFNEYAKTVLVPALNRVGVKPVGAFSVNVGPNSPTVYLLLPHPSLESVVKLDAGLLESDAEYRKGVVSVRALPPTDPLLMRIESSLMQPFDSVPEIQVPTGPAAAASRVFELRTYESPNRVATRKKIEMFEKGGEIAIFRRVGMAPVFFARDVIGTRLPSLTYMLVFPDMAARDLGWATFGKDPEWGKLSTTPGYTNAEILSGINSSLLRPTDYSQV